MGSSFIPYEIVVPSYLLSTEDTGDEDWDVWKDTPTTKGIIVYSVLTPIICLFGICGNGLSLLVLRQPELRGSVFTYLAVLAIADLFSSVVLFLGGICKGAMWGDGWAPYDALISLPVGGFWNSLGVLATVAVTIDRVVFLWKPCVYGKQRKLGKARIARRVMLIGSFCCLLFNLPYCFIFDWGDDGTLVTTEFFDTNYYNFHNWIYIGIFVIASSIILVLGNGFLIYSLQKAKKLGKRCNRARKKHQKETSLSITLIAIIVCFLVSEIPANLVSRTCAISVLFQGDHEKANSKTLEVMREICTLIGAVSLTLTFVLYYLFCPQFCKALKRLCKRRRSNAKSEVHLNVFVIKGGDHDDGNIGMKPTKRWMEVVKNLRPMVMVKNSSSLSNSTSLSSEWYFKKHGSVFGLEEEVVGRDDSLKKY